ncbi:MAG: hypothetical protein KU37_10425 [Sulfuricurvum sp. PC08-66]|nr:MAG: hypothetical protein KU37_10425 [Sulfuricurvum sp. PC08-66]
MLFFSKEEEGTRVEIGVDDELIEVEGDVMTPTLVFLFIKATQTIENFEAYCYENSLIDALSQTHGLGYFVGLRYTQGWIELYYYSGQSKQLRHYLQSLLPAKTAFEIGSHADEKWHLFHEKLLPNALEKLSIENRLVLEALEAEGDTLGAVHLFEHTFYCQTASQRDKIKAALVAMGYTIDVEFVDDEMDARYILVAQHEGDARLESVDAFCVILQKLAQQYHAHYDGWSTTLQGETLEQNA